MPAEEGSIGKEVDDAQDDTEEEFDQHARTNQNTKSFPFVQTTGSIIDYVEVSSKIFLGGVVGHWRGESQRLEIKISGI